MREAIYLEQKGRINGSSAPYKFGERVPRGGIGEGIRRSKCDFLTFFCLSVVGRLICRKVGCCSKIASEVGCPEVSRFSGRGAYLESRMVLLLLSGNIGYRAS